MKNIKKLLDGVALVFVLCLSLLSVISILGVWEIFENNVIEKSFQTIGLLAIVSVIVMVAGRFLEMHRANELPTGSPTAQPTESEHSPNIAVFESIRRITLVVLIISVSLLALIGILSIWDLLSSDVTHKSLASIAILVFWSLVTVAVCMEREGRKILHTGENGAISPGRLFLIIVFIWFFWMFFQSFLYF